MLPTSWVARSYLSFSGAFMALVYSPHSFREIGVIRGHQLRHRSAEQLQFVFTGWRRQRHVRRGIEIEARLRPDVEPLMHAFQPKTALPPGEQRLAGEQRFRLAARRDEFDLRHEHPAGM